MTFLRCGLKRAVIAVSGLVLLSAGPVLADSDTGDFAEPLPLIQPEILLEDQSGAQEVAVDEDVIHIEIADTEHAAANKSDHAGENHKEAKSTGGLPQLNPESYPSQLFWLLVIFLGFYTFLSRQVLPALSTTLENRHERIEEDLGTAQSLKEQAEEVHKAFNEILEDARQQTLQQIAEADQTIKDKSAASIADLNAKSSERIQKMEANAEKAKDKVRQDMDGIAAEIATATAKKIVGLAPSAKTAQSVIEKLNRKAA